MGGNFDSDSDSISPPLSPILGHSGDGGFVTKELADAESAMLFCFNCKGCTPRPAWNNHDDNTFASDGLIVRRQLITALESLTGCARRDDKDDEDIMGTMEDEQDVDSGRFSSSIRGCYFHRVLDPMEPTEAKFLLNLARRNIHTLQSLANPKNNGLDEDDEEAPWELRKQVVHYFNVIVSRISQLKSTMWRSMDELDQFFASFKDAFGHVVWHEGDGDGWPSYLTEFVNRNRDGNETSSALYHLFHVILDIRWSLLVIYGMNSSILSWILDDLVQLAWAMFHVESTAASSSIPMNKTPFNCWCVKELWTMIRLLCEELNINFWTTLTDSLQLWTSDNKRGNSDDAIFFPLWLITHLATLSDFSLNGQHIPLQEKKETLKFNGYPLVGSLVKQWTTSNSGGITALNSCPVYHLLFELSQYWGFELEIVVTLWKSWLEKVDKFMGDLGAGALDNYSSIDKWFKVIQAVCPTIDANNKTRPSPSSSRRSSWPILEMDTFVSKDPFLSFLKVLVGHAITSRGTEWKKLKAQLGMTLGKNNVSVFGEIGLVRVSTLYLALVWAVSDTTVMCDRLKEILHYGKPTPARTKAVFRATSTAIFILLQKSESIASQEIAKSLMDAIASLFAQGPFDSGKKDNISVYFELLDTLPRTPALCSTVNLSRDFLISPSTTMWLTTCGPNHVVRTLRTLSNLTDWIINSEKNSSTLFLSTPLQDKSSEGKALASKIFERTSQFLTQAVISTIYRTPTTDVEPMSTLAADLTLISKWNISNQNGPDSVSRLFDHFALSDYTCPEVSQFYVTRLLAIRGDKEFANVIRYAKWCQVWIRLNAFDCCIPDRLNEIVLEPGFSSTSNSDLLDKLCEKIAREEWSMMNIQNMFRPFPTLVKAVTSSSGIFKTELAKEQVSSMVRFCTQLLGGRGGSQFDRFYVKGDSSSVGVQLMTLLIPSFLVGAPMWERWQKWVVAAMKNYLFDLFKAMVDFSGFCTDPFLHKKVNDLTHFALLGYLDSSDLEEFDHHPGVRVMLYAEDHELLYVLQTCVPAIISNCCTGKDSKLNARFVHFVSALKNKGHTTPVMRFLPGILTSYANFGGGDLTNLCIAIIAYCLAFSQTPFKADFIMPAFESAMESSFAFKSKRFFDLATMLSKPGGRPQIKKFVRFDLLPLLQKHVRSSEQRRGTGTDMSLRNPLEKLERDTATF